MTAGQTRALGLGIFREVNPIVCLACKVDQERVLMFITSSWRCHSLAAQDVGAMQRNRMWAGVPASVLEQQKGDGQDRAGREEAGPHRSAGKGYCGHVGFPSQ